MQPADTHNKTRRQRVEDRELSILTAARDIFNARGYGKTTIADIAKQSGVADGTVYLYFKNKEALARGVLGQFYNDLTRTAQDGVDALSTTEERLRFLARHHLEHMISHRRLLEMLPFINISMDNYQGSDLYDMNKAYAAVFDRVAKDGAAQGQIRGGLAPWALRDMFFGSMDYATRTIMLRGGEAGIDIFVDNLSALLLGSDNTGQPRADARLDAAINRLEALAEKLE